MRRRDQSATGRAAVGGGAVFAGTTVLPETEGDLRDAQRFAPDEIAPAE